MADRLREALWLPAMVVVVMGSSIGAGLVLRAFGWWAVPFLLLWAGCVEFVVKQSVLSTRGHPHTRDKEGRWIP